MAGGWRSELQPVYTNIFLLRFKKKKKDKSPVTPESLFPGAVYTPTEEVKYKQMMQQSWPATMASSILDSLVHTVKTAEISVLQIYSPLWANPLIIAISLKWTE